MAAGNRPFRQRWRGKGGESISARRRPEVAKALGLGESPPWKVFAEIRGRGKIVFDQPSHRSGRDPAAGLDRIRRAGISARHFASQYRRRAGPRGLDGHLFFFSARGERSHWHRVDADGVGIGMPARRSGSKSRAGRTEKLPDPRQRSWRPASGRRHRAGSMPGRPVRSLRRMDAGRLHGRAGIPSREIRAGAAGTETKRVERACSRVFHLEKRSLA